MLMPHPAFLRRLLDEYDALRPEDGADAAQARLRDLEYTLCVSTGTRDVTVAVATARDRVAATAEPAPLARSAAR
ncbi:DUF5133 domain-containing protein [Streptomyces mangrovisoli]|uniref:DUF5133 domain-containing protein n=1 Tax=Streptomyces mangrovisoli TaxID=1428628 RepID=A0A1J4NZ54_9ACTN|nr:DUF5133 domain-containing protein [Streptomyces mangrovisoli]OIJ66517.1 DUF5133 domain-containing protein [Streptomyces mangrovisoli]